MRYKVTRQCPQTTTFEAKGEPKQIRTEVLLITSLTPYRWAKPARFCASSGPEFPLLELVVKLEEARRTEWLILSTTWTEGYLADFHAAPAVVNVYC